MISNLHIFITNKMIKEPLIVTILLASATWYSMHMEENLHPCNLPISNCTISRYHSRTEFKLPTPRIGDIDFGIKPINVVYYRWNLNIDEAKLFLGENSQNEDPIFHRPTGQYVCVKAERRLPYLTNLKEWKKCVPNITVLLTFLSLSSGILTLAVCMTEFGISI